MSLNKQHGNMYPWVTHTWNPIKGKCPHECEYCYMNRFPVGDLRLDKKCFNDNLGEGNTIFVGSSCDMFAVKVPEVWIKLVFQHIRDYQGNTYLLQSKNPERFEGYFIPPFVICGTTIESNRDYGISKAPSPVKRFEDLYNVDAGHKMVSIEPILHFDINILVDWIQDIKPDFVSIGADSKNNGLPEPSSNDVKQLIDALKQFTEVRVKSNLKRLGVRS